MNRRSSASPRSSTSTPSSAPRSISTRYSKKLDECAADLKTITEKTGRLAGNDRKNVDTVLYNVKQITQDMKEMTEDVKKYPWKLIRKA